MRLTNVVCRLRAAARSAVMRAVPDRWFLQWRYRRTHGRRLNLKTPRTFDEKLQWLNLHDRDPRRTQVADKLEVRRYVERKLGLGALNPLLGVWTSADAICFDALPDSFVLKMSHGSGWNILCPDKSQLNPEHCRAKLRYWLRENYYLRYRERHYRGITPRILGEPFLHAGDRQPPHDFKFYCFGGRPLYVHVDIGRFTHHRRAFFHMDWRPAEFMIGSHPPPEEPVPRPSNFEEMRAWAAELADGFPFVRADFYSIAGTTIFGEMTLMPDAGFNVIAPACCALTLGEKIPLPRSAALHAAK